MKPLLRWTIGGNPHIIGFYLLKASVLGVKKLFGNRFDYVICYNNLTKDNFRRIKKLGIDLYEQSFCCEMEYEPKGVAWKLYPPRLRPNSHEIFLDNDVVLHGKPSILEEFLSKKDLCFITEGYGNYGRYKEKFQTTKHVNSGFFGIPPLFPFLDLIKYYQKDDEMREWQDYFDEQGLVASCLLNHKTVIVPFEEINICDEFFENAWCGTHFVRVNVGHNKYLASKYTDALRNFTTLNKPIDEIDEIVAGRILSELHKPKYDCKLM